MPNSFRKYLTIGVVALALSITAKSQTTAVQDNDDLQSWNDVQLTVGLSKKVDLYSAVTMRFGKNVSRLNDGRFAIGLTFKPTGRFSFTPFVTLMRVRNSAGVFGPEYRINLRGIYRFPVKAFGLSHRSLFEYRIRPTGNLWRFRPSVTFEKELPEHLAPGLKFFVTEEPIYDSASGRFSRNRFSVGFNKVLSKNLSLDIYYLRQGDNFSNPGAIDVIGTAWKIKL